MISRDFVEVQGYYLKENSIKEIKFIEDDDTKLNDSQNFSFLSNHNLSSTIMIGKEITIDYNRIPL